MVLFCDFDGVLHPYAIPGHQESRLFCCRHLLWQILGAAPELEVVISSTWRRSHQFENLVDWATAGGGEHLAARFIGATPELPRDEFSDPYRFRERECLAWLYGNGQPWRPWVALDDVPYGFSMFQQRLIAIDPATGLTNADVPRVIAAIRQVNP